MRFMYRQGSDEDLQHDLNVVLEVLNSGYFIAIDLFFWAFFLTIFTTSAHHSFKLMVIVYIGYYVVGFALFILLKKWFNTEKFFQKNNN